MPLSLPPVIIPFHLPLSLAPVTFPCPLSLPLAPLTCSCHSPSTPPCHFPFTPLHPGTIAEESVLDVYESVMDCQVGHRNADLYVWPVKYAQLLQLAGTYQTPSYQTPSYQIHSIDTSNQYTRSTHPLNPPTLSTPPRCQPHQPLARTRGNPH